MLGHKGKMYKKTEILIISLLMFFSCSSRVTLNYDYINESECIGQYGTIIKPLRYNTLSMFLIKLDIKKDQKILYIRSGINPKKVDHPKTWYVNICDTLQAGEKRFEDIPDSISYTYTSRHSLIYKKNRNLYIRFRTWLSPQEVTTKLYKDFWENEDNKQIWNNWEKTNF